MPLKYFRQAPDWAAIRGNSRTPLPYELHLMIQEFIHSIFRNRQNLKYRLMDILSRQFTHEDHDYSGTANMSPPMLDDHLTFNVMSGRHRKLIQYIKPQLCWPILNNTIYYFSSTKVEWHICNQNPCCAEITNRDLFYHDCTDCGGFDQYCPNFAAMMFDDVESLHHYDDFGNFIQ